jgi:hypothetical protein
MTTTPPRSDLPWEPIAPLDRERLTALHARHQQAQSAEDKAFMAAQEDTPNRAKWLAAEAQARGEVRAYRGAVAVLLNCDEAIAMAVLDALDAQAQ